MRLFFISISKLFFQQKSFVYISVIITAQGKLPKTYYWYAPSINQMSFGPCSNPRKRENKLATSLRTPE